LQSRPLPLWRTRTAFIALALLVGFLLVSTSEFTAAVKLGNQRFVETTLRVFLDVVFALLISLGLGAIFWQRFGGTVVVFRESTEPGRLKKHWQDQWHVWFYAGIGALALWTVQQVWHWLFNR